MRITLDQQTIQTISMFQNITGSTVVDSIADDELYFVVQEGQFGMAIGKNGSKIKKAERAFKRPIRIFEYAPSAEEFVKKIVPDALEIKTSGEEISVKVKPADRSRVIGKGGKTIKIINQFLSRLYEIKEMKVK